MREILVVVGVDYVVYLSASPAFSELSRLGKNGPSLMSMNLSRKSQGLLHQPFVRTMTIYHKMQ